MLRQRTLSPSDTAVEHREGNPTLDGDDIVADPRWIDDDGRIIGADELIWSTAPVIEPSAGAGSVTPETIATETDDPTTTDRRRPRRRSWGQPLIVLAGVTSLVFGIGAIGLGGLAGSVTEPVVEVFTFDHTPLLGLLEIAVGAVLVLTGLVRGGRWIAGPVGVAVVVAGALVVAELDWVQTELAAHQRFGWVPLIVGSVAYLGAMVPARRR